VKLLKQIAKQAPLAYKTFFGRRYLLPNYRQADYMPQPFQNEVAFDRVCTYAAGAAPSNDEPWQICLGNTVAALNYNRPTLFLERELGEALMHTDILETLQTGDLHWRWPAFRVYLPSDLVTINREAEQPRWAVFFDIAEVSPLGFSCPLPLAKELDQFIATSINDSFNLRILQRAKFQFKEHGMAVSTALNKSDHPDITQTIYAQLKPWGLISVTKYINIGEDLKGGHKQDEADRRFLKKLEHLVLNVMLFLSSHPEEYEPFHVLRGASLNPRKPQDELVRAHFVGDAYARARSATHTASRPTGRHVAAHWVSGHWRRIAYGVGLTLRRLQWIQPYQTTDEGRTISNHDQELLRRRGD
jgi:hypothetical protein